MISFAEGINSYKLIWIFAIGCFLGYVVEMIWCYIKNGYFESRKGLVYGMFSPVYGLGAVILTIILIPVSYKSTIELFFISFVIGTVFEYICSYVQEKVFGTISWDYSDTPLNIGGRTNAIYGVFWGVLGVVFVSNVYPTFSRGIEAIPNNIGVPLTYLVAAFFILNVMISALAVWRREKRKKGFVATNILLKFLDKHYTDERLSEIYANMVNPEELNKSLKKERII